MQTFTFKNGSQAKKIGLKNGRSVFSSRNDIGYEPVSGKSWMTSNNDIAGHHRIVSCCNQTVNTNTRDQSKATPKMKIDLSSVHKGGQLHNNKRSNRFSTTNSRGDEESMPSSLKSLGIDKMRIMDID